MAQKQVNKEKKRKIMKKIFSMLTEDLQAYNHGRSIRWDTTTLTTDRKRKGALIFQEALRKGQTRSRWIHGAFQPWLPWSTL